MRVVLITLALLGGVHSQSSCCFVVQDSAHEVYWSEYETQIYTAAINLTSITTLVTPYPTTTITNYETNIYPTSQVLTTSSLVTRNPVSLYPNPAYAFPQSTETLDGSEPMMTGGVTIASPTAFRVYSTAKIFAAAAVTDENGSVACGTLSSFSYVASTAAACVPTFTGINANAAASYASNAQGVVLSLTTPFIRIPTLAGPQTRPTGACAQGNGTENYGYPAQQLIDHLAGNAFYSAQYPGIENCIPAGPTIQAVKFLMIAVTSLVTDLPTPSTDPPASSAAVFAPGSSGTVDALAANSTVLSSLVSGEAPTSSSAVSGGSTESAGGGLTSSTTMTVTVPGSGLPSTSSPASTSSVSSFSVPTALPDSAPATSSTRVETVKSGGVLPDTSTATSSLSSIAPPLESSAPSTASSTTPQTPTSISSQTTTSVSSQTPTSTSSHTPASTSSQTSRSALSSSPSSSSSSTEAPTTVEVVLSSSLLVPDSSNFLSLIGPLTRVSNSILVIVPSETTTPLVAESTTPTSTGLISTAAGLPATGASAKHLVPRNLLLESAVLVALGVWSIR